MGLLSYIKIGGFVILLAAIGGAYWYFNWSQKEMQTLRENNTKLELAIAESEAAIAALRDSMREAVARFNATNQKFQEARENNIILRDRLGKHELGALAEAKPGLVENIINRGSANVGRCFEILSGSPLTESERAATKKSQINSSCPDIANPNYVGEE
jgi:hypothetical protein